MNIMIKNMIDAVRGYPSLTTSSELVLIHKLLTARFPKKAGIKMLEIGSWMGCSSVVLGGFAKICGGKLYCCDRWEGTPGERNFIARTRDVYGAFWKNISRHKLAVTVCPLRGYSQEILPMLADRAFDFVYIDGDHKYNGVRFDIREALRLVTPGGTIAGHDYDISDVSRALLDNGVKHESDGRIWWTPP